MTQNLFAEAVSFYQQTYQTHDDLETFAQLAEFVSQQADGDYAVFMRVMNQLTVGTQSSFWSILVGPIDRTLYYMKRKYQWLPVGELAGRRFSSRGFAADDNSNQVQHFWYSVAVAYGWGIWVAEWQARYHEWNGPGVLRYLPGSGQGRGTVEDLELSLQGVELGRMLMKKTIDLASVGNWLRQQLG